jgi:DNA-directed RNA polymerase specialized sigma subunit
MEYFTHMRMEYARRSEEGGSEVIRRIEDEENRRRLARGREALTRTERQVVDLRFEEGLTAGEISRRVGWASPRKVYSLIESALNKFRKEMIRSTEK